MKKLFIVLSLMSGLFFTACDTAKSSAVTTTSPATTVESDNQNAAAPNNKAVSPNKVTAKNGQNAAPVHAPASSLEKAPSKN